MFEVVPEVERREGKTEGAERKYGVASEGHVPGRRRI